MNVQSVLNRLVEEGQKYGLEMNWSKTVQIQTSTSSTATQPNGEPIKSVREAVYLGGLITCDGRVAGEISRRIGECSRVFDKLEQIWAHAAVTTRRKLDIYAACVASKLLCSMESLWLLQADRARLDAFHCRRVRKLLRICHEFYSPSGVASRMGKNTFRTASATPGCSLKEHHPAHQ